MDKSTGLRWGQVSPCWQSLLQQSFLFIELYIPLVDKLVDVEVDLVQIETKILV